MLHTQPQLREELHDTSDHVPILTTLLLKPDQGPEERRSIKRDSKAEEAFVEELTTGIARINVQGLTSAERIDLAVNSLAAVTSKTWLRHSKEVRITKHSNPWWNDECEQALREYRASRRPEDYRAFRNVTRQTKRVFFDRRVNEIAETNSRPWDLMGWIQQRKLPPCEAIRYRDEPCHPFRCLMRANSPI